MKKRTHLIFLATALACSSAFAQFGNNNVIRLNGSQPIINQGMFNAVGRNSDGSNINGPSLIRIPDWIPRNERANRNANYYLYFAHHNGEYIRMAWAANVTGPYTLYQANASLGDRGVLDDNRRSIELDNNVRIEDNHIASPDVHVDNENRRIIMYFHAGSYRFNGRTINNQRTWVNTSSDGLDFRRRDTESVQLGDSYFRVFEDRGTLYAMDNRGIPRRARDSRNPWRPTSGYYNGSSLPELWERNRNDFYQDAIRRVRGLDRDDLRIRHTGVRVSGREAQVFFSERGDRQEHIRVSRINLNVNNWTNWNPTYPGSEVLRPVAGWEGGQFTLRNSEAGSAPENVNQLRDPDVFQDNDGSLYLLYSGRGEDALGIAALSSSRQRIVTRGARHDTHTRGGNLDRNNYGSGSRIRIQRGSGSQDRRSFLRFDRTGAPRRIEAAVLRLWVENSGSGNIEVFGQPDPSWTEGRVTHRDQPRQGSRIARVPMGVGGQWYEFDVTAHVENTRRNNQDVGFVIRATNDREIIFTSSEGNSSRRPQLKFMYRQ